MKHVFGWIIAVPLMLIIYAPFIAFDTWVGREVWNWYAVPILGAPALTMASAYGLGLVTVAFTSSKPYEWKPDADPSIEDRLRALWHMLKFMFWKPAMIYVFAWIGLRWMP